jgi:hypothetical protein
MTSGAALNSDCPSALLPYSNLPKGTTSSRRAGCRNAPVLPFLARRHSMEGAPAMLPPYSNDYREAVMCQICLFGRQQPVR